MLPFKSSRDVFMWLFAKDLPQTTNQKSDPELSAFPILQVKIKRSDGMQG